MQLHSPSCTPAFETLQTCTLPKRARPIALAIGHDTTCGCEDSFVPDTLPSSPAFLVVADATERMVPSDTHVTESFDVGPWVLCVFAMNDTDPPVGLSCQGEDFIEKAFDLYRLSSASAWVLGTRFRRASFLTAQLLTRFLAKWHLIFWVPAFAVLP